MIVKTGMRLCCNNTRHSSSSSPDSSTGTATKKGQIICNLSAVQAPTGKSNSWFDVGLYHTAIMIGDEVYDFQVDGTVGIGREDENSMFWQTLGSTEQHPEAIREVVITFAAGFCKWNQYNCQGFVTVLRKFCSVKNFKENTTAIF